MSAPNHMFIPMCNYRTNLSNRIDMHALDGSTVHNPMTLTFESLTF